MARITYQGRTFESRPGETVLDCLERGGKAPPSSCRSGHCQSCLMRATAGEVPADAQKGLKDAWKVEGLFLACACKPASNLAIADVDADRIAVRATLVARERLSHEVVRLRLRPAEPFGYRAGQFVSLVRDDGLTRPYSLASLPGDDTLELHVRRVAGGQMSSWLCDAIEPGDELRVRGPSGECFYVAEPDQPLLLAGTSTGLAPLLGVVRDALGQGHEGPITLLHGSLREDGLYLGAELAALARAHDNLTVVRCVLHGPASGGVVVGSLEALLLAQPDLKRSRAWLCGAPGLVTPLKKKLFIAGMPLRAIATDPFLQAPALAPA